MKQNKNEPLERRLRDAVEHASPEVWDRLEAAAGQPAPRFQPVIAGGARPRRRMWGALAGAAAALLLLVGGGLGWSRYTAYHTVDSIVEIDVNPSVELRVNPQEKVIEAIAVNEDAAAILDGMDLAGTGLDVALNALIGSMLKNGYIDELANSILISVNSADAEKSAALQRRLAEDANRMLATVEGKGAVLSQALSEDDALRRLARDNGISTGKAALIQNLVAQDPLLSFEELAGLSVNQLNLLAESRQTALQNTVSFGSASEKAYIGSEASKRIAFADAGVAESAVSQLKTELDCEDGRMVYEIEFAAGSAKYEYDVDAVSGEIIKKERESQAPASGSSGSPSTGDIGLDKAKAIALQHAGVAAADAAFHKAELDTDDGVRSYELEFSTGTAKYEYDINADSGAVLKSEKETWSRPSGASSTGDIGLDRAKAIALQHAGVAAADAAFHKAELDTDDGVRVYELEFTAGGVEYDYEIDAASGSVRKAERERED